MHIKIFLSTALAAGTLALAAGGAQASTVTDAYLYIDSDVALNSDGLHLTGSASGQVSGDPSIERQYSLWARGDATMFNQTVFSFDETLSTAELSVIPSIDDDGDGDFSMNQAYGAASDLLSYVDLDDELDDLFSGLEIGTEYETDFDFWINRHELASFFCGKGPELASIQTGGGGWGGDCLPHSLPPTNLSLKFDLVYEGGEQPAPIPLPATLPLLAAGLGGVAGLRRLRKPRA